MSWLTARFGILGPVEAWKNGRLLRLGGCKQRTLLAVLLLHANRVVSVDRLIDELWDEAPPPTARAQIQRYVSVLRQTLTRKAIVTSPPGYLLRIEDGQLDLHEFNRLVRQARAASAASQLPVAAHALRAALSLWRGPPLGGAVGRLVAAEAARLGELRMAALEERIEVEIALGWHADLVAELTKLVAEQPLRDRLRGQLMVALYRSGRRADALAIYRSGRQLSIDELGLDPAPELQELERKILRADQSLFF